MAGYFQLFAEPYVMTQGGPLQSTVSVLYFMYEEGFRWWNLGVASAVAFLLFLLIFAVTLVQLRVSAARRQGRMNPAARRLARQRRCWPRSPRSRLFPLLWMLSVSLWRPARPARFRRRSCRVAPTLDNYRELFAQRRHGALPRQQRVARDRAPPRCRCSSTSTAGYAFAKLRFAGRDALFQLLLGALVIPGQVAMMPLFLMLKPIGLVNNYGGVIVPAHGEHLRHLPRAPIRAVDPRRLLEAARIDGAGEFRIFRCDRRAGAAADPRHAGRLHVPRHLERLHVAADRADRQRSATRCRSRWPLSREHVADNELMMAGAVVTMLPVLLLFVCLQRYYSGLTAGSVKA